VYSFPEARLLQLARKLAAGKGLDTIEDLVQVGRIALFRASDRIERVTETAREPFAYVVARRAMISELRGGTVIAEPRDELDTARSKTLDDSDLSLTRIQIEQAILGAGLTPAESVAILDQYEGLTDRESGIRDGKSPSTVRSLRESAYSKLRAACAAFEDRAA
jgi:RNA polymerase sigma factor (sigma-70 family)